MLWIAAAVSVPVCCVCWLSGQPVLSQCLPNGSKLLPGNFSLFIPASAGAPTAMYRTCLFFISHLLTDPRSGSRVHCLCVEAPPLCHIRCCSLPCYLGVVTGVRGHTRRADGGPGRRSRAAGGGVRAGGALVEGTSLPDNGACKHYRHSYRWLRFPCCGEWCWRGREAFIAAPMVNHLSILNGLNGVQSERVRP